ncbi:MAG TPA: hypothetical protein VEK08_25240 [Planctomycetota bacterium]|nr:hypothetical protein [Planctomycetota bacterium]
MKRERIQADRRKQRGVTLIMVAGVLAVLAALATGFYSMMLMQTKSASRYADSVRAEMMARAGVEYAIAHLRSRAYTKTEDPTAPWFTVDYLNGAVRQPSFPDSPLLHDGADNDGDGVIDNLEEARWQPDLNKMQGYSAALSNAAHAADSSDRFTLNVYDAASRININACDNLGVVLDNLCRAIGPPLVAADQDALLPYRWAREGAAIFDNAKNKNDRPENRDIYYQLFDKGGNVTPLYVASKLSTDVSGRPKISADGRAIYGDGYAIAAYRARKGRFQNLEDIKAALSYVERSSPPNGIADDPLEQLEVEVKFSALREHITVDSWVDTNTVCVGKFEWISDAATSGTFDIAIDRDKSWVPDDLANDPMNQRGSLRGCYLSIINGHGAGQLRRIRTNGVDWVQVDVPFAVPPGPTSSYMIIAPEDAKLVDAYGSDLSYTYPDNPPPPGTLAFPKTDSDGNLVDAPGIDYSIKPLCIHRAPVNINTATDKVLVALFLGLNIQQGHPLSVGTDVDLLQTRAAWKKNDPHKQEPYLLTPKGLKRVPESKGKIALSRPKPWPAGEEDKFGYISNHGNLNANDFTIVNAGKVSEAHELAYRVIMARTRTQPPGKPDPDPTTADSGDGPAPYDKPFKGFERGPFRSWDDLYFRVIKPWDDIRSSYFITNKPTIPNSNGLTAGLDNTSVARVIMAHFNSNTDVLKFNPNIEWIDRWGRNFTEMEAVMAYTDAPEPHLNPPVASPITDASVPIFSKETSSARGNPLILSPVGSRAPDDGAYIIRSFRYRAEEMIDKTDLNRSTTEFSFDSNGIYEIHSTGQMVKRGELLSERKVYALVKVYDVWRESTQQQFTQGTFSDAANQWKPGQALPPYEDFAFSGQVARDAEFKDTRKALNTLPEPLVPPRYRIKHDGRNKDVVEEARDAFGNTKDLEIPDVVANKILPARYDGQIVLATNTLGFDPANDKDTFLASYNGDLDTETSAVNGREQAKMPHTPAGDGYKYRVVDTCSLLGILNDDKIDIDTDLPAANSKVYRWAVLSEALKALNPMHYWENVTLRVGDLRTDGVYLSSPANTGNDGTLKYLFGDGTQTNDSFDPGKAKGNFDPGSKDGSLVTMWFKPNWHHNDRRTHDLFDATNPGYQNDTACRALYLKKHGNLCWSIADGTTNLSANRNRTDDLNFSLEGNVGRAQHDGQRDKDLLTQLHGGINWVRPEFQPDPLRPQKLVESPHYRVQPFRWHYAGARWKFNQQNPYSWGNGGHWVSSDDFKNGFNQGVITNWARPFISTQSFPEQPGVSVQDLLKGYWSGSSIGGMGYFSEPCDVGDTGLVNQGYGTTGQPAKYKWADPAGVEKPNYKTFGMNNLNQDDKTWIYRHTPADGTFAVIDELKISSKERLLGGNPDFVNDRAVREQTMSRYYLPKNPASTSPADPNGCPYFTSQTMLQSLKGFDKKTAGTLPQQVVVARVSWTVFTPRFLHENKVPTVDRNERITRDRSVQKDEIVKFRGPFDYDKYNESYTALRPGTQIFPHGVDRPTPNDYLGQSHSTQGVEIEILEGTTPLNGAYESAPNTFTPTTVFHNPDVINRIGDPANPKKVSVDQLRYRVRFRYPVDKLVDPNGGTTIDPAKHFLLDTPVFDDISITYFAKPRVLSYREIME